MENYELKNGICYEIIFKRHSKNKTLFPKNAKSLRWEKEVDCHFCESCND